MLLKLIKYDLKFIFKTVSFFIILLIIGALLFNLTSYDYTPYTLDEATGTISGGEPTVPIIIVVLHSIFYNVIISMLIGLIFNTVFRIWARFKRNFYGDEAYLTHTLPISRNIIWASKFISSVITLFIVSLSIGLAAFILHLTPSGQNLIGDLGFNSQAPASYSFVLLLSIFVEFLFIITCGFTGIIIGRRANNHQGLHSVIAGFTIYVFCSLLLLGFIFLWSRFDSDIQAIFVTTPNHPNDIFTHGFVTKILLGIDIVYIIMLTVLYLIDQKLLRHGINLN